MIYSLWVVLLLAGLIACSSGLQPDAPAAEDSLAIQGTSVSHRIPNSESDAEEVDNVTYIDSPVLELGYKTASTPQTTGLRFLGVNVPPGVTVTDARLEFTAVTDKSGAASLEIYALNYDSTGPFKNGTNEISKLARTSASVSWTPGSWSDGETYTSPNLASVVQEIVSRPDWVRGAAIAFTVEGTGLRKAYAYDANKGLEPVLKVTYGTEPPPTGKGFTPDLSMTVNPSFSLDALKAYDAQNGTDAAVWYARFINSSNFKKTYDFTPSTGSGTQGALRAMGRIIGQDISTMLLAFRVTGDPKILDRVEEVMSLALSDKYLSKDRGYLAWSVTPKNQAFKVNALEETLAYGAVAQATYAFYLNRNVSPKYNAMYNQLKDFLRNNFEKRYEGSDGYDGGSITDKSLFHAYTNFTRYYWYMHLMLKDSSNADERADAAEYAKEAKRKGDVILRVMRTDPANNTYVFPHRVWPEGWSDCTKLADGYRCAFQMMQYPQETAVGFNALIMDGFEPFSNTTFAQKLARSYELNVFNGGGFRGGRNDKVLSSDVGRNSATPCKVSQTPDGKDRCVSETLVFNERDPNVDSNPAIKVRYVTAKNYGKGQAFYVTGRSMAILGIWDTSGETMSKTRAYYKGIYGTSGAPKAFDAPAVLLANELYKAGRFSLD